MKKTLKISGIGLCCAGMLAASSAKADLTLLTFDENGNTTGLTGEKSILSSIDNLPSQPINVTGGVGASTLDYLTPIETSGMFGGVGSEAYPQLGWVAIYAPGGTYGTTIGLLDLIHFDNSYTGGNVKIDGSSGGVSGQLYDQMFFYSTEGSGNKADFMPSSSVISSVLSYAYTTDITEDASGDAYYTPGGSSYAGYSTLSSGSTPTQYKYEFESVVSPSLSSEPSPVPEPSTIISGALLLLPFGVGVTRILRKNLAAQ